MSAVLRLPQGPRTQILALHLARAPRAVISSFPVLIFDLVSNTHSWCELHGKCTQFAARQTSM